MLSGVLILYLVLFVLCLVLSAFFSSSETSFVSLQRLRLRHLANTEVAPARQVVKLTEKPEKLLTTILLGNNFVNTAAAALGTAVAVALWAGHENLALLAATIGVTTLLLVFCEIGPKTLATRHGERLAFLYATPMRGLVWALSPLTAIFAWIGDKLARAVGGPTVPRALISEDEIRTAISAGVEEGTLEQAEAEMLHKVFRFGDRQVGEVMTPRTDIVWVEKGTRVSHFLSIYAEAPHARFPVYEHTTDNVVGTLWIRDVLMGQAKGQLSEETVVDDLMRQAYFVPETKMVAELFAEMQAAGRQTAVVVDEFGGTAGLVTMSQLVEEIVGDKGDELAKRAKAYEAIDEKTYEVDGGMRIEEANEELGLGLPQGSYETMAGFVLSLLGHIPKEGEVVRHANLRLAVSEMKGLKIERVVITRL